MKRIRERRLELGLTQKELSSISDIPYPSIRAYETEVREPKAETLEKIATALQVPISYLQGNTDDPDGFDLWENATGYDQKQIQHEIERMKKANRVSSDETLQHLIGRAVANLDGDMGGETDAAVLNEIQYLLSNIRNEVLDKYYLDPKKVDQLPKLGNMPLFNPGSKHSDGSLFYDDMNADVYNQISEILSNARNQIASIKTK
ncbi:XRE family transcriptional regulator [Lactobacillus sp. CBA3605]|uniref:helix-turn-helix domain-containing protein n=1 Tax=Lactobacillus sp. CBA3605 TaxID=2099788 RepID=UPI000CFBD3D4|nr:helix-turn-helix transcriptional regulator [Lactobacillus sp. CBA3605]AVK61394.1 XRE family transcriptional regulator [Lactobacillus sp. CBA3605]